MINEASVPDDEDDNYNVELPVFSPSQIADIPANTITNQPTGTATWTPPTATDNSAGPGPITVTSVSKPGDSFPIGTNKIIYTATDPSGNSATLEFNVLINDIEVPVFTSPPVADITVNTDTGQPTGRAAWTLPTATDNSAGPGPISVTSLYNSGDPLPIGTNEVIYTATDPSGNKATFKFNVIVRDEEDPVFTSPPFADINENTDTDQPTGTATWTPPTATDNSAGPDPISATSVSKPGDFFPIGTNKVIYTATDPSGNSATFEFNIIITDNQNPYFIAGLPPSVRNQDTDTDQNFATVTWERPTAGDNSQQPVTVTSSPSSPASLPIGNHEVTITATDSSSNTQQFKFTVVVSDNQAPTFDPQSLPPSTMPQSADTNEDFATVTWDTPTATDNSGGDVTVTQSRVSGSTFPIGSHQVSFTATDAYNNVKTYTFTIVVSDSQVPVFTKVPDNPIEQNTDDGRAFATVTWETPIATDNSGADATVTSDRDPGTFTIGEHTVTFTATDENNNRATYPIKIIITDKEKPKFTPSSLPDISGNTENNLPTGTVTWTAPDATDNSGQVTVSSNFNPDNSFGIGDTRVVYTAKDASENTETLDFVVTVTDDQKPVITDMPTNILEVTDPGVKTRIVTWVEPTASDNSNNPVRLSSNYPSGHLFEIGDTEVKYTATDDSNNEQMASFIVTVKDKEAPVFTSSPISNKNGNTDTDAATGTATWQAPSVEDNSDQYTLTSVYKPDDSFPIGTTLVIYTATDPSQNFVTMEFTVTITDNQKPKFNPNTLPDISMAADSGKGYHVAKWTPPTASDNSQEPVSLTSTHNPDDQFNIDPNGIVVTYTARDIYNNVATLSFTVTVTDTQDPQILNVPDRIVENIKTGDKSGIVIWIEPTATDNSGHVTLAANLKNALGNVIEEDLRPPITLEKGQYEATYTAKDPYQRTTIEKFNIDVQESADSEDPVITGTPDNMDVNTDLDKKTARIEWTKPQASDNSGSVTLTGSHESPFEFLIGSTTVIYTAKDPSGNEDSTSFTVTVTDNQKPTFDPSVMPDIAMPADQGKAYYIADWVPPTATDNSEEPVAVSSTHNPKDQFNIDPNGVVVTYTAVDQYNNMATLSFTVTVTDTEKPTFITPLSNITTATDPSKPYATVNWEPPETKDNSGKPVTLKSTHNPGETFGINPAGIQVIYTAEDVYNNQQTLSFNITVKDKEPPNIINLPRNFERFVSGRRSRRNVSWTEPSATDNSGVVTLSSTHSSGDNFDLGLNTVVYTAIDDEVNTAMKQFTVTLKVSADTEIPTISSMENINQNTDLGEPNAEVNWEVPTATDNYGTADLTSSHNPGDTFVIGNTVVTYTATDEVGNVAMLSFTVTIIDAENPTIETPNDITANTDPNQATATVSWTDPPAEDNSGSVTLRPSVSSGGSFAIGTTEVSYTVTDPSGNMATAGFVITVLDVEPPVFISQLHDIFVTADPGSTTAIVTWRPPSATDNSNTFPIFTSTHQSGAEFNIGQTSVSYTATDGSSNEAVMSFVVYVKDILAPVISGLPIEVTANTEPGEAYGIVTWTPPTVTDNTGAVTLTTTHQPGSNFGIGIHKVVYTAIDQDDNVAKQSFVVKIKDEELPTITRVPNNIIESINPRNRASAIITWLPPTAEDNSGDVTLSSSHIPGDTFSSGTTSVSYIAKDPSGNFVTSTFTVTIRDEFSIEPTPPEEPANPVFYNVPQDITQNTDPNQASAVVNWQPPLAIDEVNSGPVTLTSNYPPRWPFPIGSTTVAYFARDDTSGTTSTASFTITVTDNEMPIIHGLPDNIVQDVVVVEWTPPTASDNSGIVSLITSHGPGSSFAVGETLVSYTATDPSNNKVEKSFTVTIEDDSGINYLDIVIIFGTVLGVIVAMLVIGALFAVCYSSSRSNPTNIMGGQGADGTYLMGGQATSPPFKGADGTYLMGGQATSPPFKQQTYETPQLLW